MRPSTRFPPHKAQLHGRIRLAQNTGPEVTPRGSPQRAIGEKNYGEVGTASDHRSRFWDQ